MTAKTHYVIYALLSVIILLLLFLVISERSARNTDISSLQGQLTEATTISDREAIQMAQNFAFSNCKVSKYASAQERYIERRKNNIWYISERNPSVLIVTSKSRYTGDPTGFYQVNIKTKQVSKNFKQTC